jgi:hypothetical protein
LCSNPSPFTAARATTPPALNGRAGVRGRGRRVVEHAARRLVQVARHGAALRRAPRERRVEDPLVVGRQRGPRRGGGGPHPRHGRRGVSPANPPSPFPSPPACARDKRRPDARNMAAARETLLARARGGVDGIQLAKGRGGGRSSSTSPPPLMVRRRPVLFARSLLSSPLLSTTHTAVRRRTRVRLRCRARSV